MKDFVEVFKNKEVGVLMVVFPHPDDESVFAAGVLLEARRQGWQTFVVILTKGGAGRIYTNPNGSSLKALRSREMKKVSKILGFSDLILGDFEDGRLRFEGKMWQAWLTKQVEEYKPDVIVTYDTTGITGHPDHIAVTQFLIEKKLNTTLFLATYPKAVFAHIVPEELRSLVHEPTHSLEINKMDLVKKLQAIYAHKSQNLNKQWRMQMWWRMCRYPREWFYEVDENAQHEFKYIEFKI